MYFYTVKTIDWSTVLKVCAHLYSLCSCLDLTVSWWGCRLLWCLGRTEDFAITKHCRKAFMSLPCCDRIRTGTHTYTHIHTHKHTHTRRDWVFSNTHRNMHMVAPLFNLHTVQFKGVQAKWRSVLLFQLLAWPTICSDLLRSGFVNFIKLQSGDGLSGLWV